ncbi:MAG TPA: septum formation initiator family protein [Ktedonobacteraceae bacterium]|nr:septum formation initiator family protein [Ktedonobacteraceae bacterium]
MQDHQRGQPLQQRPGNTNTYITSAVGLEEPAGRLRARRSSLFSQTIVWVTALICMAFLLGSLVQAWSNSQLMQRVQEARQQTQQLQAYHGRLVQQAKQYQDPSVIESEARQQLGYIRPGEHPVIIMSSDQQGQQNAAHPASPSPVQNFWQRWWNVFFGS